MSTVLAGTGFGVIGYAYAQEAAPSLADPLLIGEEEEPDEVLFEADSVSRESETAPIVAEGDVKAFFGERYLRADRLEYDPTTDVVTAEGNVSITDEDLETIFANKVVLSGDLRDGIAENFSALMEDNTRLAADNAVQERGARTRLSRAVYTACNVCNKSGDGKTPTWRIKSLRVVRDRERKVVRFHHAFLEIKGIPILYTPFLQGPDPSVERQSGFLPPRIGISSRLGFNFELPYYLAISNHQDATFHPKITTSDGVLWQGEYRRRGKRGYHALAGGVINFKDGEEPTEDVPGVRWHYFGRGHRDFAKHWRVSYDFERVSDNTYLRNYDIERRGDLRQALDRGSTNQLRSNARVAWNKNNHHLTIDSYLFQGLRSVDDAKTTPYVLPTIDYRHDFTRTIAGGRASVGANITSLYRTGGTDSQRFSASANWGRDIITDGGHRFKMFSEVRGDAYFFQDLNEGTEIVRGRPGEDTDFQARILPSAGVEWSYPLSRTIGSGRLFLEPRVQLVASLADRNKFNIINEDSQSIEFDYAGLFDFNKATGYDAYEDGQRANIGVAASAVWPNGFAVEATAGQQFRIQQTEAFRTSSGLGEKSSDIVGSLNVKYKNIIGVENRFRIDDDTGSISRAESLAFLNAGPIRSNVSYVRLNEENISANLVRREELTARAYASLNKNWYTGAAWRVDLVQNRTIRQDFIVGYRDECSTFGVTYSRNRTTAANLPPDNRILFTFTLASLVE